MHPYLDSPKIVVIAGPRCSGKTYTANKISSELMFTCISQDHVRLTIQEKHDLAADEMSNPKTKDFYKKEFLNRIRELRYSDIVIEGARMSHGFILDALIEALHIEYGQYFIIQPFFIMPTLGTRYDRYAARIKRHVEEFEQLQKKATQNTPVLKQLAEYITSPFDAFPQIPKNFPLVRGPEEIIDWIKNNIDFVHPDYPNHHASLIESISTSDTNFSPFYQTIDIANERIVEGQTRSYLTWDNISKLDIDWKNKKVCEIGCNNGYFLFKAELLGAKCHGYDISQGSVDAAKDIARYINSKTTFAVKNVEDSFDEQNDILFALNMLHYIKDLKKLIHSLATNTQELILEIGKNQIEEILPTAVKCGHRLANTLESHRKKSVIGERVILHLKQKQTSA